MATLLNSTHTFLEQAKKKKRMGNQTITETCIFGVGMLQNLRSLMNVTNWQEDIENHEILFVLDDPQKEGSFLQI